MFLGPILNGRKPVLEGVHVVWGPRSCPLILPFRFVLGGELLDYSKVVAKQKKFD